MAWLHTSRYPICTSSCPTPTEGKVEARGQSPEGLKGRLDYDSKILLQKYDSKLVLFINLFSFNLKDLNIYTHTIVPQTKRVPTCTVILSDIYQNLNPNDKPPAAGVKPDPSYSRTTLDSRWIIYFNPCCCAILFPCLTILSARATSGITTKAEAARMSG